MDERESAVWLLRRRLLSLTLEIRHWKAASRPSEPKTPPLPPLVFLTNYSQIRAFALIVHRFVAAIYLDTRRPECTAAEARAHAKNVLALFRIWEFFRAKIAQRLDRRYLASLQLADEFAWACYSPAAAHIYKEPPLVFLNGGLSPFILPRNREFAAEFVPNELIQNEDLTAAMARLPFPVIGMPWYQVATPWELPVIAHEVGHSIEGDLKLTKGLRQSIVAAVGDESRRARWTSWCSEIFADFYGCLAVGPAFVSNLAEFLAGTTSIADDLYPPASIRLQLNLAYLGEDFAGFATEARARWKNLLAIPPEYIAYADPDIPEIAAAFRSLDVKLTRFAGADYQAAFGLAQKALRPERIDGLHDVRTIVVALRIAYDAIMQTEDSHKTAEYMVRLNQLVEVLRRSSKPDVRASVGEGDTSKRKAAHLARSHDWLETWEK